MDKVSVVILVCDAYHLGMIYAPVNLSYIQFGKGVIAQITLKWRKQGRHSCFWHIDSIWFTHPWNPKWFRSYGTLPFFEWLGINLTIFDTASQNINQHFYIWPENYIKYQLQMSKKSEVIVSAQTDRRKPICLLNVFKVWGNKTQ